MLLKHKAHFITPVQLLLSCWGNTPKLYGDLLDLDSSWLSNLVDWPKSSFGLYSTSKKHIFHFHQELYWTTYSPFCSTLYVCVLSHSVVSDCDLTARGDSQAKIPEWGCHFLLQGIFPTQRSNLHLLCLLHWQADASPLCHLGSPFSTTLCHFSGNFIIPSSQSFLSFCVKNCSVPSTVFQGIGIFSIKRIF